MGSFSLIKYVIQSSNVQKYNFICAVEQVVILYNEIITLFILPKKTKL